jgi:hypothetical protein
MGFWAKSDRRHRIFAATAATVAVASVLYALILKYEPFGEKTVIAIDDVGEALAAAIACAACAWAAHKAEGRNRLGWALMSISTGLWSAGQVVWSIYEVVLGQQVPQPGLVDVGFLSAVPFAVVGIRAFWGDARGTSARWRVWFDGLIVAIALTSTAWGFGLRLVWEADGDFPARAYALSYPVGDILIGTILILAIRRASGQQKGRLAFLLCGVAAYSIADSAFAYLTAQNAYGAVGSVLNTGWFTGFLLVALAAVYPAAPPRVVTQQSSLDLWQLALPWMTLLTAAGGDFYTAFSGQEAGLFQPAMTVVLAILLTVNMILERREFLEMLNEIESSRSRLNREFKSALAGIQRFSKAIRDAERLDAEEMRRLAGGIHREAERLDQMIDEIVEHEDEETTTASMAAAAAVATSGAR